MSLEHADLKTLCRATDVDINGDRETLVAILIGDGTIVAERQALLRRELRAEAIDRGLDAEVETWNVGKCEHVDSSDNKKVPKAKGGG